MTEEITSEKIAGYTIAELEAICAALPAAYSGGPLPLVELLARQSKETAFFNISRTALPAALARIRELEDRRALVVKGWELAEKEADEERAAKTAAEAGVKRLREALADARIELNEAADKFNVLGLNHCNCTERQGQDKAFMMTLVDRMNAAAKRAALTPSPNKDEQHGDR